MKIGVYNSFIFTKEAFEFIAKFYKQKKKKFKTIFSNLQNLDWILKTILKTR